MRPSGIHLGQRFGRLKVTVAPLTQKISDSCTCQCDCGAIKVFSAHNLIAGMSTSCGCSRNGSRRPSLLGKKFGRLTVVGHPVKQHGRYASPCLCDCGESSVVNIGKLLAGATRSCGCLLREGRSGLHRTNNGESMNGGTIRYRLLSRAKTRSKEKNVPFDLVLEDIVVPSHCPLLGIPLVRNKIRSSGDSFTIDEIIPGIGYIKGNVQVISFRANTIKSDATFEELELLVKNLKLQRERLSAETQTKSEKQQSELTGKQPQEDTQISLAALASNKIG
jgi:hypothetical protein